MATEYVDTKRFVEKILKEMGFAPGSQIFILARKAASDARFLFTREELKMYIAEHVKVLEMMHRISLHPYRWNSRVVIADGETEVAEIEIETKAILESLEGSEDDNA